MKKATILLLMVCTLSSLMAQTSKSETKGYYVQSASWIGGTVPGTLSGGTITATSKIVVMDGTVLTQNNLSFVLSNVSINAGDTLVVLGNLNLTGSILANNGVLVVLGDVNNLTSTNFVSGTGTMVVTGDYNNAVGGNTFTGPSYVYGDDSGFFFPPALGDESDLIAANPGLHNYVNTILGVLPVELLNFNSEVDNGKVTLYWSTASEINNDHFILEWSSDGTDFHELGHVGGAGTTNDHSDYSFVHEFPANGYNYYRLSQVDFDGTVEVFDVIAVNVDIIKIEYFPNPTTDYLFIKGLSLGEVIVVSEVGGRLNSQQLVVKNLGDGKLGIDATNLRTGIYNAVSITGSNSFRFIKQ